MKLGIPVNSEEHLDDVIGITKEGLSPQYLKGDRSVQ